MNHERIIAAGNVYLDTVAQGFPVEDFTASKLMMGKETRVSPGGSVLTFARTCASLDLQTVVVGKIGTDPVGNVLRELVDQPPNLTPLFIASPEVSTNMGIHAIREDKSEIRINFGTANQVLTIEEIYEQIKDIIPDATHFYLGGVLKQPLLLPHLKDFTASLQARGIKVVIDHGRVVNPTSYNDIVKLIELFPYIDYYLPSRDEFLEVWDAETIEEGVRKVRNVSQATIVIKDGENGAIGVRPNGELFNVPVFPIEVRDTVGAGDTFNAGLLKGQIMQLNLEESIVFASATAAYKISHEESEPPTEEQVLKFIDEANRSKTQQDNALPSTP